jgi:uncharacterized protein with PQ loop repeat
VTGWSVTCRSVTCRFVTGWIPFPWGPVRPSGPDGREGTVTAMDWNTLAQALAYLGSAIGVAMVVPQILRIVANPRMGGVSPWTWAITATACTLWLTYGARTASMPQIPGNVLLVAGAVAIVVLVPARWSRPRRAVALLVVTLGLVLGSTALAPAQVGFLAFGIGLTGAWPQVFETVWARRGMGPSAISLTSNAMKLAAQVCWLTFALMTTDAPVLAGASMALFTNSLITSVELGRRRTAIPGAAGLTRQLVGSEA